MVHRPLVHRRIFADNILGVGRAVSWAMLECWILLAAPLFAINSGVAALVAAIAWQAEGFRCGELAPHNVGLTMIGGAFFGSAGLGLTQVPLSAPMEAPVWPWP